MKRDDKSFVDSQLNRCKFLRNRNLHLYIYLLFSDERIFFPIFHIRAGHPLLKSATSALRLQVACSLGSNSTSPQRRRLESACSPLLLPSFIADLSESPPLVVKRRVVLVIIANRHHNIDSHTLLSIRFTEQNCDPPP